MSRGEVERLLDDLSGGGLWVWNAALSVLVDQAVFEEEAAAA